jgi:hypothetical protein
MTDSVWASIKTDWHDDARCKDLPDKDSERIFFPSDEESENEAGVNEALENVRRAFCNLCPVRGKCLNSATINKDWGLWAGTTRRQRQAMARTLSRTKCPLCSSNNLVSVDEYEVCTRCGASWRAVARPAPRPTAAPSGDRAVDDIPLPEVVSP